MKRRRFFERGAIDPISVGVFGFLIIGFIFGVIAVVRNGSFDIRERAQGLYGNCQPCTSASQCQSGLCGTGTGSNGCLSTTPVCLPRQPTPTPAPLTCVQVGGHCVNNALICTPNNILPASCPAGQKCADQGVNCTTDPTLCTASQTYRCNGSNSEYCAVAGAKPVSSTPCSYGCNSSTGQCKPPPPLPVLISAGQQCPQSATQGCKCTTGPMTNQNISYPQSCAKEPDILPPPPPEQIVDCPRRIPADECSERNHGDLCSNSQGTGTCNGDCNCILNPDQLTTTTSTCDANPYRCNGNTSEKCLAAGQLPVSIVNCSTSEICVINERRCDSVVPVNGDLANQFPSLEELQNPQFTNQQPQGLVRLFAPPVLPEKLVINNKIVAPEEFARTILLQSTPSLQNMRNTITVCQFESFEKCGRNLIQDSLQTTPFGPLYQRLTEYFLFLLIGR